MGAGQVLRAAVAVAALVAACHGADPAARIAAGVIDARPYGADAASYDAALAGLAALPSLRVVRDTALAGRDAAEAAIGTSCTGIDALVEEAALARLATPPTRAGRADLARLFGFAFRCADAAPDRARATLWVERLRALGLGEDPAWAAYPEIDATSNAQQVLLRVEGHGEVAVDLRPVGAAPVEVLLDPGRHWLAADGIAVAHDVTNRPPRQKLELATPRSKPPESLQDRVRAWRRGRPVDEHSLAQAMRDAGLVLTVLLVPSGPAEVWKLDPNGRAVRVASVAAPADPAALAKALGGIKVGP